MEFSVIDLFQKGGGFMWPILILGIITLLIIIERSIYYCLNRGRLTPTIEKLQTYQEPTNSNNPLLNMGETFMASAHGGKEHCLNVTERESSRTIRHHERGIRMLALIAAISPLVGLLGTVWGMVIAFAKMAKLGESVTPGDFADGIWTGLLTTVAGLLVAIPAMSASKIFEARVDKLVHNLNELSSHLRERFFPGN